jgi:predicted RNase H-like nuclease (RuvC/YqgF family)
MADLNKIASQLAEIRNAVMPDEPSWASTDRTLPGLMQEAAIRVLQAATLRWQVRCRRLDLQVDRLELEVDRLEHELAAEANASSAWKKRADQLLDRIQARNEEIQDLRGALITKNEELAVLSATVSAQKEVHDILLAKWTADVSAAMDEASRLRAGCEHAQEALSWGMGK